MSVALTLLTGVLFGRAPALHTCRLLLGAGLRHCGSPERRFTRTLSNLRSVALGFNPDRALAFDATAADYALMAGDRSGFGVSGRSYATAGQFVTSFLWVGPDFFSAM